MNAKTIEKLTAKSYREVASIVLELESALKQVKYHQERLQSAADLDDKAGCLDAINRNLRQMKSHINETALAYIAGMFDAESED